jgi:hypothetical protein
MAADNFSIPRVMSEAYLLPTAGEKACWSKNCVEYASSSSLFNAPLLLLFDQAKDALAALFFGALFQKLC